MGNSPPGGYIWAIDGLEIHVAACGCAQYNNRE